MDVRGRIGLAVVLLTTAGCAAAGGAPTPAPATRVAGITVVAAPENGIPTDQVDATTFTTDSKDTWQPRLHAAWPQMTGAIAFNDASRTSATRRITEFTGTYSDAHAGTPQPSLSVNWQAIANANSVVGARLEAVTFGGASTATETWTVFGSTDGKRSWTGADLVNPDHTDELRSALGKAVVAKGWVAGGDRATTTDLLQAADFSSDGSLRMLVSKSALTTADHGRLLVTVPADAITPLLSDDGRATQSAERGTAAPSSTATPSTTADTPAPASATGASDVDCATAKCIALTFDDGPGPYTGRILDTLQAAGARATFFTIGRNVAAEPELVAREVQMGMAVGDHTWTHPDLAHMTDSAVVEELTHTATAIEKATGTKPFAVRPPYGAYTKTTPHAGMPFVLWDVDTEDWKNRSSTITTQRALAGAHRGAIVLMHDIHPSTMKALPGLLAALKAKGYTMVTVPELLGQQMDPTKGYFSASVSR